MSPEIIFKAVIKDRNFFTPVVVEYIGIEGGAVEISKTKNQKHSDMPGASFMKDKYGVTVVRNWKHDKEASTLCNSLEEALKYVNEIDKFQPEPEEMDWFERERRVREHAAKSGWDFQIGNPNQ